jgi:hypothetical protein
VSSIRNHLPRIQADDADPKVLSGSSAKIRGYTLSKIKNAFRSVRQTKGGTSRINALASGIIIVDSQNGVHYKIKSGKIIQDCTRRLQTALSDPWVR